MSDAERIYDEVIAPALLELAGRCEDVGISLIAVVEYAPGEYGQTKSIRQNVGLSMKMLEHCAKTRGNIDGYIIGLARYARENGIDVSRSIVMQRFMGGAE